MTPAWDRTNAARLLGSLSLLVLTAWKLSTKHVRVEFQWLPNLLDFFACVPPRASILTFAKLGNKDSVRLGINLLW